MAYEISTLIYTTLIECNNIHIICVDNEIRISVHAIILCLGIGGPEQMIKEKENMGSRPNWVCPS